MSWPSSEKSPCNLLILNNLKKFLTLVLDFAIIFIRSGEIHLGPEIFDRIIVMTLTTEQIETRLASTDNLVNQLKSFHLVDLITEEEKIECSAPVVERNLAPDPPSLRDSESGAVAIIKPKINYKNYITNPNGKNGSKNLTENERIAVGVLANTHGEQIAADMMGVSTDHAHHLKSANRNFSAGMNGKDVALETKIRDRLTATKLTAAETAATTLISALGIIDGDKLDNCTAKEAAQISSQMSQVVRNLTPQTHSGSNGDGAKVTITMHQPKPTTEENFDTIEIVA
jgi:hypothetical protein